MVVRMIRVIFETVVVAAYVRCFVVPIVEMRVKAKRKQVLLSSFWLLWLRPRVHRRRGCRLRVNRLTLACWLRLQLYLYVGLR